MSLDGGTVTAISILGNDYSIKAPAGQEQTLAASALMLKKLLAETKQQSPALIGDRLLVLTALKLCAQQIELQRLHQLEIQRIEEQLSVRVDGISALIKQA